MSPLTPEEPELAVAIVMEPESSEVPTPLVTLTAPPVLAPTPPAMDTAPPTAPLLPSPMPAVSVSAPPAALSAVVLPAVTVTAPPAPVLPSPTLREIAPPAPPVTRLHRKRPRRPGGRLPAAMSPLTPEEPELAVAIVMEPESSEVPTPLVTLTAPPVDPPLPPVTPRRQSRCHRLQRST